MNKPKRSDTFTVMVRPVGEHHYDRMAGCMDRQLADQIADMCVKDRRWDRAQVWFRMKNEMVRKMVYSVDRKES